MNEHEITLREIKRAISELPPDSRARIETMAAELRVLINIPPSGEGQMALALVGAELAAMPD